MRLALQTVVCWCVLIAVLPLGARGGGATTLDINSTLKKRFRLRRDVRSGSVSASGEEGGAEISNDGTQQQQQEQEQGNTDALDFLSSFGPSTRSKRSGCVLATCAVHDLYHKLHLLSDKLRQPNAPEQKIKPGGYGRRRRRSAAAPTGPPDGSLQGRCCSREEDGAEDGAPEPGEPSLD